MEVLFGSAQPVDICEAVLSINQAIIPINKENILHEVVYKK